MHIGLCTISNSEAPIDMVLSKAASTGYDGVEIWGKGHVDGPGDPARRVRKLANMYGLEIPVFGSYLRPGTSEFVAEYESVLETAIDLDVDLVRVWAGEQEYGDHDPGHWDQVVADLHELSNAASARGVDVTVEKHEGTLTNSTEGARRLITAVDKPNCGLNWQPLFGMEASAILAEARELASLSNNMHIQAVPSSGENTRCALSDAFFDVESIITVFRAANFNGYVNVEFVRDDVKYTTAIENDLEYLRSI